MATHFGSNSFPEEFNFIENPIIVRIGSSSLEFPTNSTFRQIKVKVTVTFSKDSSVSVYNFYADASGGKDLSLDISSALRSAMKGWEPDASDLQAGETFTYPNATFSVVLSKKYLLEGMVFEDDDASEPRTGYAYYGGMSEYDLMTSSKHVADKAASLTFTSKPASGELRSSGDLVTSSSLAELKGKVSTTASSDEESGIASGVMQQFLFINSYGVLESVSAQMRESLAYSIDSIVKNLASSPAYFAKPNRTSHKTGGRAKLQMSSGVVNRAWADWWTTEFLMAKKYWMKYDGRWIPVVITPADDTTTIYNKAEQMLPHVDFDVELAVCGSIINKVRNS